MADALPPRRFVAGDSFSFKATTPAEAEGATACDFILSSDDGPATFAGVVDGDGFLFEITSAQSTEVPPAVYAATLLYHGAWGRRAVVCPPVSVLPDPTKTRNLSVLEQALVAAKNTIKDLSGMLNSSTTANGITMVKRQLSDAWDNHNKLVLAVNEERSRLGLPAIGPSNKIKNHKVRFLRP